MGLAFRHFDKQVLAGDWQHISGKQELYSLSAQDVV